MNSQEESVITIDKNENIRNTENSNKYVERSDKTNDRNN